MGKKSREEREQKRENYADKITRQKIRFKLIAGGIAAALIILLVYVGIIFYQNTYQGGFTTPGTPKGAGNLGDEHEHASMMVLIFGDTFDFSTPAYQVKNRYIHFENHDGFTVHRHASGVPLGFLFETLKIKLTDDCYVFPDKREFCANSDYSLKFFINHKPVPSILDYVLQDDDRILISYGNENSTQIDEQLAKLDSIPLNKS